MILALLALAAVRKKASFPLMSYALAFTANWYGHLCMMGLYPIALACGMEVELPVFYRASGMIRISFMGILISFARNSDL